MVMITSSRRQIKVFLWVFAMIFSDIFSLMTPAFAVTPPSPRQPMSASMDIVKKFDALCEEGKFEEASQMLADDFAFTHPKANLNKTSWLKEFPALHADKPTFEAFQQGATSNQIRRKGKKKIMMMNISMLETWEITEDGKIKSINAAKA